MTINFKANFVTNAQVSKLNPETNEYYLKDVSFVKLSSEDKNDVSTVRRVRNLWQHHFAEDIYQNLEQNIEDLDTYALVEQQDKFKKINPNKVLGLVQMSDDGPQKRYLDYLVVNPEYSAESVDIRKFKNVGTEILNCLKKIFSKYQINVGVAPSAIHFYEKNGFVRGTDGPLFMLWKNCKTLGK